jgi:plasmid maintenance system antidote protein VapI
MTFAEMLDAAIDKSGRPLRRIAEQVGISAQHLHDLRRNRRGTSPEVAEKLAVVLGLDAPTFVQLVRERAARDFLTMIRGCPHCGWPMKRP